MLDTLKDNSSLPSARALHFTKLLFEKHQEEITTHRNPKWMQFALIAIAIVFSGIIPGILALLAYSHANNKTSPLFFTKSAGQEYVDKMEATVQKNTFGNN